MGNDALLQAAMTAARGGDIKEAAALFARLVKEDPTSEQGWLGLGFCCSDKKQREYCFRRVLTINPNNKQAKQSLELLGTSVSQILPDTKTQPPSIEKTNITQPDVKQSPAVSPFFLEDSPLTENIEEDEPVTIPVEGKQEEVRTKEERSIPLQDEPIQLEVEPTAVNQQPAKKGKPLLALLWISLILLIICFTAIAYLYLSGRIDGLLQANPFPTWTSAQFPTQAASPTTTSAPSATASLTRTPPTPTFTPAIKPTLVYSPIFSEGQCKFVPPEGVHVACGYVKVPEDRLNQKSKFIQLAVAVFHSTSPNPAPDPVIFLQGGPGGEAVSLSANAYNVLVKPFLSTRDYIAFDQRGTGLSIPALGCDELEGVYKQDIEGQIPSSSRELVYTNAFRSCHGAMIIGGIELNSYTTAVSSDDLKDIVTALGYKQVNLFSASYGTRLALVTMRDHPEIVKSAVLDSLVPVEERLFNEDPIRYNSALQALFNSCAVDAQCNATYPDLETVFWNLVDQLNAKPVKVTAPLMVGTNTENVDGADLIGVTLGLLKSTKFIAYVPEFLYKVKSGDFSTFVVMQSALPYEFEGINIGLYISMMCHEQILSTTPDELQVALDSKYDVGRYFRLPFFGNAKTIFNTCKVWGANPPAAEENAAVVSGIPTLIIEGKYDPVTPPIFGLQVASKLSHSYYMEFPNLGHTPTVSDSSGCAFGTMLAFFENPEQKPDMTCLAVIKGVEFVVP